MPSKHLVGGSIPFRDAHILNTHNDTVGVFLCSQPTQSFAIIPPTSVKQRETHMRVWTVGNAAKLYCMNWIADYASQHQQPITLLDLGCGTALNFVALLQEFPYVEFVGIEPSASECAKARENLKGLKATVIHGYAYEAIHAQLPYPHYDLVTSFSVFEHVYERLAYLQFIHSCLKPNGYCLMNYDAGHFHSTYWKEHVKTWVGGWLARMGNQSYFQAFVKETDFQQWAVQANLSIQEAKMFNTALKGVYHRIPVQQREAYMQRWLELENWLNTTNIDYSDKDSKTWYTRNYILQHKG
jgi:SAM-dependent methyltransferase